MGVQPLLPGEKLRPVRLMDGRGRVVKVGGVAHYAGLPRVVGEGMRNGAIDSIKELIRTPSLQGGSDDPEVCVDIAVKREPRELTRGAGSGIVVWAEFENGTVVLGGSAVGKKGVEPSEVGRAAVEELNKGIEAGGCVDEVSAVGSRVYVS